MELQPQQRQAFEKIQKFITDDKSHVFILKGYAGTGKTTMAMSVIKEAQHQGKDVLLLAPTGRAAKILREKTHHDASTIHSAIYNKWKLKVRYFDKDGKEVKDESLVGDESVDGPQRVEYHFALKRIEEYGTQEKPIFPSSTVIIVDESSMISSKEVSGELFHFGTDILLDDLLTFAELHLGSKLIFIGDPAQLPPVGDNCSKALDEAYFQERNLEVDSFVLTDVLRQGGKSAILQNAMRLRTLLSETKRNALSFQYRPTEFEAITADDVVARFIEAQPLPEIGDDIVVCYSNSQVGLYNIAIRQRYFPDNDGLQCGDVLQIVKNDYNHHPVLDPGEDGRDIDNNLYNGDFIKVLNLSPNREELKSFKWINHEGGKQERVPITFCFRDVEFLTSDGRLYRTKILENLLESDRPSLSPQEHAALYINLKMRNPKIQKDKKALDLIIREDPYFNALQVKYGYAITAHKSQGGEWRRAYVDYSGRNGFSDECLRWMYTATTRATKTLYAVNAPNITPLDALKINPIKTISKAPKNICSVKDIDIQSEIAQPLTGASPLRRRKFATIKQNLNDIGCDILRVDPLQYCDRYTIRTDNGNEIFECWYNDSGMFSSYQLKSARSTYTDNIMNALQDESSFLYDVQYVPSMPSLSKLYSKVTAACDELEIPIMNIQEFTDKYYVLYSFKTSGRFSLIQFYFKGNGSISYGNPSSDLGDKDELLTKLVEKLSKN